MSAFNEIFLFWRGRVSKKTYWLCALLPIAAISLMGWRLAWPIWVAAPVLSVASYIGLTLSVKRAHDLGRTGFFVLLLLVPLVNVWALAKLAFVGGTEGENRFGPPDTRFPNVLVDE